MERMLVPGLVSTACMLNLIVYLAAGLRAANREPWPEAYRTPEAAALAAYWRQMEVDIGAGEALSHLLVNVPPDRRALDSVLAADLDDWSGSVRVVRDTAWYGGELIEKKLLESYQGVWDVRPASAYDHLRGEVRGTAYAVANMWCVGWPCHQGAQVDVIRVGRQFVGRAVILNWVE